VLDELDAPPEAELGGVAGLALEELEELSFFEASTETEPDAEPAGALAEPEGLLGVVVEPADDEDEPAGGVVRETARSPASRSQPAIRLAPSAMETATARVDSFIRRPPWLG
jgi:hypothetical protein